MALLESVVLVLCKHCVEYIYSLVVIFVKTDPMTILGGGTVLYSESDGQCNRCWS